MNLIFNVVISSTLNRSIHTAELITGNSIPVIQNKLCNERDFGIMEGHTWDEVQHFDPPILFIEVGNDKHSVNPKGGEPLEDVWQRAKRFCNFLFRNYRGKTILVVSHGVFLQMFHGVLKRSTCIESLAQYPANLELSSFCFDGNHLKETKVTKLSSREGANF
jgi:broad specificity phosphatase PhoE